MKNKICIIILLAFVCLMTACPAPEFNHVIINQSDTVLEVEYEYVSPQVKYDSSQLGTPLKMSPVQDENAEKVWSALTAENEFSSESNEETSVTNPSTGEQTNQKVTKVKLKLLPNEILRVFVSSHINVDVKSLKRLSLQGKNGELEIEGTGFEQFAAYRPDRFFTDTIDYRIVYR